MADATEQELGEGTKGQRLERLRTATKQLQQANLANAIQLHDDHGISLNDQIIFNAAILEYVTDEDDLERQKFEHVLQRTYAKTLVEARKEVQKQKVEAQGLHVPPEIYVPTFGPKE